MTDMQQTSLEAYSSLNDLGTRQRMVYETIEEQGPVCNREIANILKWEINCVTGRVKELRDWGKVEFAYKAEHNDRKVMFWKISQNQLL